MTIYYYLINLWPVMILLVLILLIDGISKLRDQAKARKEIKF